MPDGGKPKKSSRISWFPRRKFFVLLALLVLASAFLSLGFGAEKIEIFSACRSLLAGEKNAAVYILRYTRLPRTLAALLAGAALAAAGTITQCVLANSLAAPSTIGVNAGAGLGAALFCALLPEAVQLVPFAAMAGAFAGVALVMAIAHHTSASRITLVLAGVAVSGMFGACVVAVVSFFPDALVGYSDFRIGGLSGVSMAQLSPAGALILLALGAVLSLHNELDILMLGTEQAQTLGLPAKKMRLVFLALAAILAGASVSFCGLIGFVGLIVPHMMRRFVGEEAGPLLAASALGGAAFLCLCDLLARVLFAPFELPVGVILSLLGGPFFILLLKKRGGHGHD